MKLKDLLKGVKILSTNKEPDWDMEIEKISYSSLDAGPESLFVALKGELTDGHKYIEDACSRGCKAALVEEFKDVDILQIKVDNTRITMADAADNLYGSPSKELNITGITATNGKTSTAFMVKSIFEEAGLNVGISGTIETQFNDVVVPSLLTTPESPDLQRYFKDMKDGGVDKVVMEVSSSGQESYRVNNVDFDVVTFNNFSREHIDQHGSFERYYEVKSRLIKNAKADAVAILNADFDEILRLKDLTKAQVILYSVENKNYDIYIDNLDISTGYGRYTFVIKNDIKLKDITLNKQKFDVELGVAGYSQVMNSVAAIIVGLVHGIDSETIVKGVKNYKGVERRFEMIFDGPFKVIDDHFANARNIEITLSTIRQMDYKKLHILYGIRGNRGVTLNRENGQEIVKDLKGIDLGKFITTKSVETVTSKDKVSDEEEEVLYKALKEGNIEYEPFERLDESLDRVLDIVNEGDVILLGGCQGIDKAFGILANKLIERNLVEDEEEILYRVSKRIC